MHVLIHQTPQFKKKLDSLLKAGGEPAGAAQRASEVIQAIDGGDGGRIEDFVRPTRFGERRIKKCRKYDLGGGYRLISIQKGSTVILLHIGTHDDADRWLERNRGLELDDFDDYRDRGGASKYEQTREDDGCGEFDYPKDDADLSAEIDDKILRSIFSGICGK